jgi:hypothetical protein
MHRGRLEKPPEFNLNITDKPTLYIPAKFNYPAIDGLIVLIKPGAKDTDVIHVPPLNRAGMVSLGFSR